MWIFDAFTNAWAWMVAHPNLVIADLGGAGLVSLLGDIMDTITDD